MSIEPYNAVRKSGLALFKLTLLVQLCRSMIQPSIVNMSLLWHVCCLINSLLTNWHQTGSSFAQQSGTGSHRSVAHSDTANDQYHLWWWEVHFLVLIVVDSETRWMDLPVTCIMFGQPLWLNAVACGLNIVNIDPITLFYRLLLLCVVEWSSDLFHGYPMKKAAKSC